MDRPGYANPCRCQLCQTLGGIYLTVIIEYSMMMNKMSTFILTFVGPLGSDSGVYCCQQVERRPILEGDIGVCSERHSTSLQHHQQGRCLHTGALIPTLSSSSSSSYSNFYVGSMYDDIRLHVVRSYTSSPDSPFSLISTLTLFNHLLLDLPLFLIHCTTITIALLPM